MIESSIFNLHGTLLYTMPHEGRLDGRIETIFARTWFYARKPDFGEFEISYTQNGNCQTERYSFFVLETAPLSVQFHPIKRLKI